MSAATIEKFVDKGWIKEFADIYKLDRHKKNKLSLWKGLEKNLIRSCGMPLKKAVLYRWTDFWLRLVSQILADVPRKYWQKPAYGAGIILLQK